MHINKGVQENNSDILKSVDILPKENLNDGFVTINNPLYDDEVFPAAPKVNGVFCIAFNSRPQYIVIDREKFNNDYTLKLNGQQLTLKKLI